MSRSVDFGTQDELEKRVHAYFQKEKIIFEYIKWKDDEIDLQKPFAILDENIDTTQRKRKQNSLFSCQKTNKKPASKYYIGPYFRDIKSLFL
jgi:hypothetical protein